MLFNNSIVYACMRIVYIYILIINSEIMRILYVYLNRLLFIFVLK